MAAIISICFLRFLLWGKNQMHIGCQFNTNNFKFTCSFENPSKMAEIMSAFEN